MISLILKPTLMVAIMLSLVACYRDTNEQKLGSWSAVIENVAVEATITRGGSQRMDLPDLLTIQVGRRTHYFEGVLQNGTFLVSIDTIGRRGHLPMVSISDNGDLVGENLFEVGIRNRVTLLKKD